MKAVSVGWKLFERISQGQTIAGAMEARGVTSGFDYLRLVLAAGVILLHSLYSSYGAEIGRAIMGGPFRGFFSLILPMFFALSGFLVCGSLFRTKNLRGFLALRALRIVPALFVEVTLSAILLGVALTQLPLSSYFTDPKFFIYLGNIVGWIHFELPGVFTANPEPSVNFSIWTIPFELECYLALSLISLTGIIRRKRLLLLAVLAISIAFPILKMLANSHSGQFDHVPGRYLVICFLAGVSFYLYKESIRLNAWVCAACLVFSIAVMTRTETTYWAALPITYVTIYLGMLNPPKIPVLLSGDYSYGLFLFGYPIQQTYSHLFPDFRVWWANALFALVLGFCVAALSWTFVEKPVLQRRKAVIAWLDAVSARFARVRPQARAVKTIEALDGGASGSSAAGRAG